jgi:uncharacterized protein YjbI with pentapeptide repeats
MAGPDTKNAETPYPIWGFDPPSPEPDTKKLDALLASLNGSAERFQTLWFSFLGVTLYLAIAALATTHRNLLLGEPQTLPILNIKVELLPFYVIAPLLYLVFHFYLLMMLALLARTAAEFDKQLRTTLLGEPERERYRAQVGNALFLQLLVGMKGERSGVNALLMGLIALITIVLAPLATLILMQMMFLPYHHLRITWWHRGVVVADLVLIVVMTYRCFFPLGVRRAPLVLGALSRKPRWAMVMSFWVLLAVALAPTVRWLSFEQGRWAGEPRASFQEWRRWTLWMRGEPPELPDLNPDYAATADGVVFGLFPDRLRLASETIVGKEKWEKANEEIVSRRGAKKTREKDDFVPTIRLDGRDLQAADLTGADLRGASLNGAAIQGANMSQARLDGARLSCERRGNLEACAQSRGASFELANLQGADLAGALLDEANLHRTRLQGADLSCVGSPGAVGYHCAHFRGAKLERAQLQGTDLRGAHLEGADLRAAFLQGADLRNASLQGVALGCSVEDDIRCAQLQGADLENAQLQVADLGSVALQGSILGKADFQGARLHWAQLQGADLGNADLSDSDLRDTYIFRTPIADASFETAVIRSVNQGSADDVDNWIHAATEFAREEQKANIVKRFERLKASPTGDQDAADKAKWNELETQSLAHDPKGVLLRAALAILYEQIACDEVDGAVYILRRLIIDRRFAALGDQLEGLRKRMKDGRDKSECPGVAGFTEDDWRALDAIKPE